MKRRYFLFFCDALSFSCQPAPMISTSCHRIALMTRQGPSSRFDIFRELIMASLVLLFILFGLQIWQKCCRLSTKNIVFQASRSTWLTFLCLSRWSLRWFVSKLDFEQGGEVERVRLKANCTVNTKMSEEFIEAQAHWQEIETNVNIQLHHHFIFKCKNRNRKI